jgi:hypothetical protein
MSLVDNTFDNRVIAGDERRSMAVEFAEVIFARSPLTDSGDSSGNADKVEHRETRVISCPRLERHLEMAGCPFQNHCPLKTLVADDENGTKVPSFALSVIADPGETEAVWPGVRLTDETRVTISQRLTSGRPSWIGRT